MARSLIKAADSAYHRKREEDVQRLRLQVLLLGDALHQAERVNIAELAAQMRPRLAKYVLDGSFQRVDAIERERQCLEVIVTGHDTEMARIREQVVDLENENHELRNKLASAEAKLSALQAWPR
jgi:septal ring factor EnvC (AmiA/AmiB activator)